MSTPLEKLKKQLLELADVVNGFESEIVQLKVVDKLLLQFDRLNKKDNQVQQGDPNSAPPEPEAIVQPKQPMKSGTPPGITRIINLLLDTDFFDTARSISEITDYANEHYKGPFFTYSTSGVLLKMVKQQKLERMVDAETGRFVYIKAEVQ